MHQFLGKINGGEDFALIALTRANCATVSIIINNNNNRSNVVCSNGLRIVLFFYWPREKGGEEGGKNKYIHKTLSASIRTKYNATYTYIHIYIERRESTLPAKLCHCANTFPSVIAHLPYRFTFLFPSAFKSSISRVASSFRAKKSFFQESKENVSIVTKILVGGEDPRLQDAHKK